MKQSYHLRVIEQRLLKYARNFPCVLVAGPRQVGKTTLLRHLFGKQAKLFTFDPVQDLFGERADPDMFLRNHPPPIILDEIQYVPGLVPSLKRHVDEHRDSGSFLITGSQQWEVMRSLSESLAGRVGILELQGFSLAEAADRGGLNWFEPWLTAANDHPEKADQALLTLRSAGLSPSQEIWRGGLPEVRTLDADLVSGWMRGYVDTYLQRDIRRLLEIRDEVLFGSFLTLCASLTAQECNYSQMGRDIGLSTPTAQKWIAAMRGTFQWLEIPAFSNNQLQRLSRRPKGYLTDTGLACYLMRISSPEALSGHPSFGALFETMMVTDLRKQVQAMPLPPVFHHYRLHSGAEIDLVLELNNKLYPVEIKAASAARPADARAISTFQNAFRSRAGTGLVIYAGKEVQRLTDHCIAVPFDAQHHENGSDRG